MSAGSQDDASSTTKTKRRTKRRLSFVEPHQCIPIEAENKPGDKKNKDMATGQAMSEDEAERIIKEMSKPSAEAAGHSDSESTCDDASSNSSSSSEDKDGSGDEDEATESEGEVSEEQSEDSSDSEAEQVQEDEGSSDEETVDGSDTEEEEEEAEDAKKGAMAKKAQSEAEESDSDSSDESCGEPEVTKKIAATKTPEVNKQDEPKKNYKKKAGQEEKNTKKSSKKEDKKEKKEKASAAKTTEDEKKQKTKKTKESKTKLTEEPCLKIEDQKDQEKKRGRGKDDGKSKEKVTSKRSKDKGDQNETGGHDASKLAVVEANLAKTAAPTSEEAKGSSSSSSSSSTEDKINSSTHYTEYLRYRRWIRNGKRFPTVLGSRLTTEEGRASLFVDWVKCGSDVDSIICKHEQSLTESRSSQVKYGFRSERWLNEKYGEEKAKRIVGRKTNLGLLIPDPEEPEDNLYFCLIDIDLKNINELKRVTSLEAKGQVSAEMVKAFTEAGGVLDGSALKGDMSGKEGMSKAVSFMGAVGKTGQAQGTGKAARRNGKANKGNSDSAPAKEVKAETPQSKAKTLITKVLKDANTCRLGLNMFKLFAEGS